MSPAEMTADSVRPEPVAGVHDDLAVVASCSCGATYNNEQFLALNPRQWVFPDEVLVIAECTGKHVIRGVCGSTIARRT